MDAIREQLKRPMVLGIAAFVLGLLIGWIVLGWWIAPVTWTDAAPEHLRSDLQVEWLRMAIDSYAQNLDPLLARERYEALGEDGPAALEQVQADPGAQNPQVIAAFSSTVGATSAAVTPLTGTPGAGGVVEPEKEASDGGGLSRVLLPILCVVLLLTAGVVAFFFLRGRPGIGMRTVTSSTTTRSSMQARQAAQQAASQAEWTDYSASGEKPMVQFMASYKLGDELFEDSFSIDSPTGEFLGECGVSISETIGVGDPKRVTSFEVWLFDKNDIQTVTKVLMSAHAFMDEATRQRLATKGEPILMEPGTKIELATQSLRLVVRAVDMGYGEGALPAQSFFDRLILELAVFQKVG